MPTPIFNPFQGYTFTDEETISAYIFTDLQLKHLQNELSIAANDRLKEPVFDDTNTMVKYTHAQEYLRGKIEALTFIIGLHYDQLEKLRISNTGNLGNNPQESM